MKKFIISSLISLTLAGNLYAGDYHSSVNKDIRAIAGEKVSSMSSVNGDIEVGKGAKVGEIDSVNGDIEISSNATIKNIDSVNGDIEISTNVIISNDIDTVNGDVEVKKGSEISGNINSVNGDLDLSRTIVKGDVQVVDSDVTFVDGTVIEGDFIVKKNNSNGFFGMFSGSSKKQKIIIGKNVVIKGKIIFEKAVNLELDDSAKITEIDYAYKQ